MPSLSGMRRRLFYIKDLSFRAEGEILSTFFNTGFNRINMKEHKDGQGVILPAIRTGGLWICFGRWSGSRISPGWMIGVKWKESLFQSAERRVRIDSRRKGIRYLIKNTLFYIQKTLYLMVSDFQKKESAIYNLNSGCECRRPGGKGK